MSAVARSGTPFAEGMSERRLVSQFQTVLSPAGTSRKNGDRTASQGVPTQPWRARLLDNSQWAVGDEDLSCHR